jgi:hypothetical protein
VPLTALATTVAYGGPERVTVVGLDGRKSEVGLDALADLVTEEGNPGNVRRVAEVTVSLAADALRDGVELVDTPGVGSVYSHNTEEATGALRRMDVAVLVLTADPPGPARAARRGGPRGRREPVRRGARRPGTGRATGRHPPVPLPVRPRSRADRGARRRGPHASARRPGPAPRRAVRAGGRGAAARPPRRRPRADFQYRLAETERRLLAELDRRFDAGAGRIADAVRRAATLHDEREQTVADARLDLIDHRDRAVRLAEELEGAALRSGG